MRYVLVEVLEEEQAVMLGRKQVTVHYIAEDKNVMKAHVDALKRYGANFTGNLVVAEYGAPE
tara:strand:- start:1747 stop:1932 length:186 start_codon:yes stop_codon:yes gene_type:complete